MTGTRVLSLRIEAGDHPNRPRVQGDAIVEYLLTTPASEWNVAFRGGPWGAVRR
jgi:hypothetical protein